MSLTAARQVADAVLYEGYLLYPYRASSAKNHVRWQFGVLGPEGAAKAGVGEEPTMSAQVVVEARPAGSVEAVLRFLQVQARTIDRWSGTDWVSTDELVVGSTRWIAFHEAVPREVPIPGLSVGSPSERTLEFAVPGGSDIEELYEAGALVGRLVRTRWPLSGRVALSSSTGHDSRLAVVALTVHNETSWAPAPVVGWSDRDVAARYSLVGTHLLMTATDSEFVSLTEGPAWADVDVSSCVQSRCWPVLIAQDDGRDAVLVAPIILGDHPTIAPESAGDLFDATEIDEILTLRVMTMTEDEKAQARGTDPRAAAILLRCDELSEDRLGRLHGGRRRDLPVAEVEDELPWWDAGQDARAAPTTDTVLVAGKPVAAGSRVLLRPSRKADAQDLFLAGLTAVVERVYFDVDGDTHLAVSLEDDPGADLYATTGRYYYFGPEEVEPLPGHPAEADAS